MEVNVPDSLVADHHRIRQVLANLLGNAMKFTPLGQVRVIVAYVEDPASGPMLHLVVRDTGIGIPADKLDLIFGAFRQVDGSTSRKYGGMGLGLSICQKLVEMMGGRIWARSTPPMAPNSTSRCVAKPHQRRQTRWGPSPVATQVLGLSACAFC